ncbi:MAG: orange carotenoid protein N-terminal domain-containing protein [Cyanobacteria bacterium J06606_4]
MPISTSIENPEAANYQTDFEQFKSQFDNLDVDQKLATLWYVYDGLSEGVIENPDDNKESDSSSDLYNQLAEKSEDEQLQFMRETLSGENNDFSDAYSELSNTTKIALWYRLGQGMANGSVVNVPDDYKLSDEAQTLVDQVNAIDFEQRYIFMRNAVLG